MSSTYCDSSVVSRPENAPYESVLSLMDAQVQRLTEVRKLLSDSGDSPMPWVVNGRKTRHIERRSAPRISEAQKKRWAVQKKTGRKK
jgi:hypothetical protein